MITPKSSISRRSKNREEGAIDHHGNIFKGRSSQEMHFEKRSCLSKEFHNHWSVLITTMILLAGVLIASYIIDKGAGQYLMVDVVAYRLPWQQARACCAQHGMELAQVLSPEQDQLLSKVLPLVHFNTLSFIWLGLQYHNGSTLADVTYRWLGGELAPRGGPWSVELLKTGTPQQCGAAKWNYRQLEWEWLDKSCSSAFPYVCQASDSPPAVGAVPANCPALWTLSVFDVTAPSSAGASREFSKVILTEASTWGFSVTATSADVIAEDCLIRCLMTTGCDRTVHLRVDNDGRCNMMKAL